MEFWLLPRSCFKPYEGSSWAISKGVSIRGTKTSWHISGNEINFSRFSQNEYCWEKHLDRLKGWKQRWGRCQPPKTRMLLSLQSRGQTHAAWRHPDRVCRPPWLWFTRSEVSVESRGYSPPFSSFLWFPLMYHSSPWFTKAFWIDVKPWGVTSGLVSPLLSVDTVHSFVFFLHCNLSK